MSKIDNGFFDISFMDELSEMDSFVHRLNPVTKLIITFLFIIFVVSTDRYSVSRLTPFFMFPVIIISIAGLPEMYILRKTLMAMPFVFFVGIFNPLIDREVAFILFGIGISYGWMSFFVIMIKGFLTVSSVLILISTTGFYNVCTALRSLKVPKVFVVQLMFLYRYIFVLIEEGGKMSNARKLRLAGNKAGLKSYIPLLGHLLIRTVEKAERIHTSMLCRGFDGEVRVVNRTKGFAVNDGIFFVVWVSLFVTAYIFDLALLVGRIF
jgi:cobalt/nickel transport system permease protein